jgi:hypothetical protein
MTELTAVQRALLDLGMEDLIALPETIRAPELSGLVRDEEPVPTIAAALIALLREDRIQVWSGHWPDEPDLVGSLAAEELLGEPGRYEFNSPADLDRRVYYVNVENLRVEQNAP